MFGGRSTGKSPFGFVDEAHLLEDGGHDQTVPNMASPCRSSPNSQDRNERYSRKVFVGGLPPDIDEGTWHAHPANRPAKNLWYYVKLESIRDRIHSFVRSFVRFRLFDFVRSISFVRFRSFDFVCSISFVRFHSFDFVRSISFVRFRSFDFVRSILSLIGMLLSS